MLRRGFGEFFRAQDSQVSAELAGGRHIRSARDRWRCVYENGRKLNAYIIAFLIRKVFIFISGIREICDDATDTVEFLIIGSSYDSRDVRSPRKNAMRDNDLVSEEIIQFTELSIFSALFFLAARIIL